MTTFSQTHHATARLFVLKSLFDENRQNIIITDNNHDIDIWKNFGSNVVSYTITECKNI